jgi:ATP-dependent DNA helicase RecG
VHLFASSEPLDPQPSSRPRPSILDAPLEIKPARAAKAAEALGLDTVGDLIEHFPFRHEERREARPIASLGPDEDVTVIGEVRRISSRRGRGRLTIQTATVFDESGPVKAVWFNQPWLVDRLPAGTRVVLHGRFRGHGRGLTVSEHELSTGAAHTTGVVPVYPATENLKSTRIRELVWNQRPAIRHVVEPLPAWLRIAEKLPDRPAAVDAIHFPEHEDEEPTARRRLAFEELFLLELSLAARKRERQSELRAPPVSATHALVDQWLGTLPFTLTGDQRAANEAIDTDIAGARPMQRLLMGEVGSGKTVVALHAMLRCVEADRQAVLMAPTETLAEQHMATLDRLLGGHVPIGLLTGSTPVARRRDLLGRLATGELGLIVGTHALIEPAVEFRDLALAVVDEQHRFGVRQRAALEAKAPAGMTPHTLYMTATPIPRTLRWTTYGELDVTTLHELPAGRQPVETYVGDSAGWRTRAYDRAREEIAAGRQVFVVCPLVEESEALQAKAATIEAERLQQTEFRDHRVALIHGQMSSRNKQEAMRAFAAREADVLVATSVIEVGIDVPNASVMIVEAAERYGISQLHQLRGRIGRGPHASVCILFGDPNLPRLKALQEHRDGFALAQIDLEIRGHGDLLGTRQHGEATMRVARLPEDEELLVQARRRADELLDRDPRLEQPEHALLRAAAAVADSIAA